MALWFKLVLSAALFTTAVVFLFRIEQIALKGKLAQACTAVLILLTYILLMRVYGKDLLPVAWQWAVGAALAVIAIVCLMLFWKEKGTELSTFFRENREPLIILVCVVLTAIVLSVPTRHPPSGLRPATKSTSADSARLDSISDPR